jgi:LPXTG-site transpeptidase (sortase) family protein
MLREAVGHVPGTAPPGQDGNAGLAAHRDTFFRGLGELKPGDVIRLTVPGKEYVYRDRFTDIVAPSETWVLNRTRNESLTLITCYRSLYWPGPEEIYRPRPQIEKRMDAPLALGRRFVIGFGLRRCPPRLWPAARFCLRCGPCCRPVRSRSRGLRLTLGCRLRLR